MHHDSQYTSQGCIESIRGLMEYVSSTYEFLPESMKESLQKILRVNGKYQKIDYWLIF
jgi:hypothetical protein